MKVYTFKTWGSIYTLHGFYLFASIGCRVYLIHSSSLEMYILFNFTMLDNNYNIILNIIINISFTLKVSKYFYKYT